MPDTSARRYWKNGTRMIGALRPKQIHTRLTLRYVLVVGSALAPFLEVECVFCPPTAKPTESLRSSEHPYSKPLLERLSEFHRLWAVNVVPGNTVSREAESGKMYCRAVKVPPEPR